MAVAIPLLLRVRGLTSTLRRHYHVGRNPDVMTREGRAEEFDARVRT